MSEQWPKLNDPADALENQLRRRVNLLSPKPDPMPLSRLTHYLRILLLLAAMMILKQSFSALWTRWVT